MQPSTMRHFLFDRLIRLYQTWFLHVRKDTKGKSWFFIIIFFTSNNGWGGAHENFQCYQGNSKTLSSNLQNDKRHALENYEFETTEFFSHKFSWHTFFLWKIIHFYDIRNMHLSKIMDSLIRLFTFSRSS